MSRASAGFVLAGGHSRRMGRDKALLPWGAGTLLEHALARLRAVCGQVAVVGGDEAGDTRAGAPVLRDAVAGAGPLGGVLTGLSHMSGETGLFLGVDLPLVPSALLARLAELAEEADAVVPVAGGRAHPLCAAYRRECLEAIRRRVAAGELKMTGFWPDVRVRQVGETELARFGDPAEMLANLNTPEEYERIRPRGTRLSS